MSSQQVKSIFLMAEYEQIRSIFYSLETFNIANENNLMQKGDTLKHQRRLALTPIGLYFQS